MFCDSRWACKGDADPLAQLLARTPGATSRTVPHYTVPSPATHHANAAQAASTSAAATRVSALSRDAGTLGAVENQAQRLGGL